MSAEPLLTIEEVAVIVENEGIGYAVTGYLSADRIEDPDLRRMWETAREALEAISSIVGVEL